MNYYEKRIAFILFCMFSLFAICAYYDNKNAKVHYKHFIEVTGANISFDQWRSLSYEERAIYHRRQLNEN